MWCAYCSECRILPFREHIDLTFRQKINKQHFLITLPFTSEEITYLCVGAFVLSFSFMRVPFGLPCCSFSLTKLTYGGISELTNGRA